MPAPSIAAEQFLFADRDRRRQILDRLGLSRYGDILLPMQASDANITCVERFLTAPDRVKFPQLQGADLSNLALNNVNLIRADLTGTNLRESSLQTADLLFAIAIASDVRGADLRGATLSRTIWTNALVENCNFGAGKGLTNRQREELRGRGGRFD
ncbi:MAG: pentapeptide repeat-containing protein [Cyanobacteria bacterium P01_E01_bin.34]